MIGSYVDRALSARTDDRPDFQRMIADSAKGLFEVVLVWKLDRFSRDRYDSAHYKHILKKNGVRLISAKENISDGPEGIILESMLEGYAEYYSAELSQKIRRGQQGNARKCMNNGGNIPLGYYVDKATGRLAVNPETAPLCPGTVPAVCQWGAAQLLTGRNEKTGIAVQTRQCLFCGRSQQSLEKSQIYRRIQIWESHHP